VSLFCILWVFHHLCSESFQLSINGVVDREWFWLFDNSPNPFLFPELLRAIESRYVSGFDLESQHACFLDFVIHWLLVSTCLKTVGMIQARFLPNLAVFDCFVGPQIMMQRADQIRLGSTVQRMSPSRRQQKVEERVGNLKEEY
jgi:hypothetical protein